MLALHTLEYKPRHAASNWQRTQRLLFCASPTTDQRCHFSARALALLIAGVNTNKLGDPAFHMYIKLFFFFLLTSLASEEELLHWTIFSTLELTRKMHCGIKHFLDFWLIAQCLEQKRFQILLLKQSLWQMELASKRLWNAKDPALSFW